MNRNLLNYIYSVLLEIDRTVQGGDHGLARVGPPSARFTCKRQASHRHWNTNYSNKLHIRLTCKLTLKFSSTSSCRRIFHIRIIQNDTFKHVLNPNNNNNEFITKKQTILLLPRAQPSFPYVRCNSTGSTAVT